MAANHGWARVYHNVSLVDCASKEVLDELFNTLDLEHYVIARVSDRGVIVDGAKKAQLARALARRGHPFRVTDLVPRAPSQD